MNQTPVLVFAVLTLAIWSVNADEASNTGQTDQTSKNPDKEVYDKEPFRDYWNSSSWERYSSQRFWNNPIDRKVWGSGRTNPSSSAKTLKPRKVRKISN